MDDSLSFCWVCWNSLEKEVSRLTWTGLPLQLLSFLSFMRSAKVVLVSCSSLNFPSSTSSSLVMSRRLMLGMSSLLLLETSRRWDEETPPGTAEAKRPHCCMSRSWSEQRRVLWIFVSRCVEAANTDFSWMRDVTIWVYLFALLISWLNNSISRSSIRSTCTSYSSFEISRASLTLSSSISLLLVSWARSAICCVVLSITKEGGLSSLLLPLLLLRDSARLRRLVLCMYYLRVICLGLSLAIFFILLLYQ